MTFNKLSIALIAGTMVFFFIIMPMVNKVQSDFSTIQKTLKNG